MIDPETIEDMDDCDGESAHVYGLNIETGRYGWGWVTLEALYEAGRSDIIRGLFPYQEDAA